MYRVWERIIYAECLLRVGSKSWQLSHTAPAQPEMKSVWMSAIADRGIFMRMLSEPLADMSAYNFLNCHCRHILVLDDIMQTTYQKYDFLEEL
jgi:hypothetical protein